MLIPDNVGISGLGKIRLGRGGKKLLRAATVLKLAPVAAAAPFAAPVAVAAGTAMVMRQRKKKKHRKPVPTVHAVAPIVTASVAPESGPCPPGMVRRWAHVRGPGNQGRFWSWRCVKPVVKHGLR